MDIEPERISQNSYACRAYPPVMTSVGKVVALSKSGLDLSETVMSDEAEGNLLKISIAKQIFILHAPKLNYSINRKLLQKIFLQIHTCIKSTCYTPETYTMLRIKKAGRKGAERF